MIDKVGLDDNQVMYKYMCEGLGHPQGVAPVLYVQKSEGLRPSSREGWSVLDTASGFYRALCPSCTQVVMARKFAEAEKKQQDGETETILRNIETFIYTHTGIPDRHIVRAYHRPTDEIRFLDVERTDEPGKRAAIAEAKRQLVEKVKARPEYSVKDLPEYKRPLEF